MSSGSTTLTAGGAFLLADGSGWGARTEATVVDTDPQDADQK
jgi:hypothetical protein